MFSAFTLIDFELDDWRRIHRASVGRRYVELARETSTCRDEWMAYILHQSRMLGHVAAAVAHGVDR